MSFQASFFEPVLMRPSPPLVEKVHLVHPSHSRLKSPAYRLCILFVFGYLVIIILLVTGRIAFIRDGNQMGAGALYDQGTDGACVIGLGRTAYVVSFNSKARTDICVDHCRYSSTI